jgi:hypothetical protein
MAKLLLLFNHMLTDDQHNAVMEELSIAEVLLPPNDLQQLWSTIPPEVPDLRPTLQPVMAWVEAKGKRGDYILIQGDFGACYLLVEHSRQLKLLPIYSTTIRLASEELLADGSIRMEHTFKHVRFRNYGQ